MTCSHCNAENPAGGKFCGACGSTLGSICSRCGITSEPDDRFCSSCGLALLAAGDRDLSISPRIPSPIKQYSPQEIEELLILRRTMRKEESRSKTLNQDDVDKLFE